MADDPVPNSPTDSGVQTVVPDPANLAPDQSASSDINRPVSTIPADSIQTPADSVTSDITPIQPVPADSQVATPSATVVSTDPLPADSSQPPSSIPTDVSPVASASAEVSTTTEVSEVTEAPVPADLPSEVSTKEGPPSQQPTDSFPTSPISLQEVTPVIPESPETTNGSSIKDSLPSDQPSQVQPVSSEPTPSVEASKVPVTAPQSAEIKPEPLQDIQNAPSADSSSPKSSFGEIMYGSGKPDSLPVVPQSPASSTPVKTTFGDLNATIPSVEPTINIEPVRAPKAEPSPISPSLPLSLQSVSPSSSLHQKATQVRQQKRDEHLAKILTLIQQKGKVKNEDIRDFLHVSQTTATDYLHTLIVSGKIKKAGKAKATVYSL